MISCKKGAFSQMITAFILYALLLNQGCARVEVQAPKDPIKMDISMRLDVYQHVTKDIDAIENIVSGGGLGVQHAFAQFLVQTAYAETLDPAVESAAYRRRDRKAQVDGLLAQGMVGENHSGLLSARGNVDGSAQQIMDTENSDRMTIYQALAQKNGTSVEEIEKLYAERLSKSAPAGSQVEDPNGSWGTK